MQMAHAQLLEMDLVARLMILAIFTHVLQGVTLAVWDKIISWPVIT
jgi:hypothetical protein